MSTVNVLGPAPGVDSPVQTPASQPSQTPPGISVGHVDPNAPVAYTPYQGPDLTPTNPAASALPPEQPIQNLGAVTKAGGAAYIGDQLLRGYMQGRALAQANQAIRMARQTKGLLSLYNSAAENRKSLLRQGYAPDSPEVKDATLKRDSAWGAYMNFMGQHIEGQTTNKKTGKTQKQNLLQRMFSAENPSDVAPAWYEAMKKLGPPDQYQTAQYNDAYRKQVAEQAQLAESAAQAQLEKNRNLTRYQELLDNDHRKPGEQWEFEQLQGEYGKTPHEPAWQKIGKVYKGKDGLNRQDYLDPMTHDSVPVRTDAPVEPVGGAPKPGTTGDLLQSYADYASKLTGKSVTLDNMGPAVKEYLKHYDAWQKLYPRATVHSTHIFRPEVVNGVRRDVPIYEENTSTVGVPQPPQPPPGWPDVATMFSAPGQAPGQAANNPVASPESAASTPETTRKGRGSRETSGAQTSASSTPTSAPNKGTELAPGVVAYNPLPFASPDAAFTKAKEDVAASTKLLGNANDALAHPTGPNNSLLVNELIKATLSRTNRVDIETLLHNNGWVMQGRMWVSRAKNGTLPTPVLIRFRQYAKDNLKNAYAGLDSVINVQNNSNSNSNSNSDANHPNHPNHPKGQVSLAVVKRDPKYKDRTDADLTKAIEAEGFEVVP